MSPTKLLQPKKNNWEGREFQQSHNRCGFLYPETFCRYSILDYILWNVFSLFYQCKKDDYQVMTGVGSATIPQWKTNTRPSSSWIQTTFKTLFYSAFYVVLMPCPNILSLCLFLSVVLSPLYRIMWKLLAKNNPFIRLIIKMSLSVHKASCRLPISKWKLLFELNMMQSSSHIYLKIWR